MLIIIRSKNKELHLEGDLESIFVMVRGEDSEESEIEVNTKELKTAIEALGKLE
jgi:hypothetical protein